MSEKEETIRYENGDEYIGEIDEQRRPNGRGKYTHKRKGIVRQGYYDGQWKDGKKDGIGIHQYSDGDVYDGPWVNGCRQGSNGTYTYCNHTNSNLTSKKYVGDWSDDNRDGHGKMVFANGDKYKGPWVNGNMEGDKGVYTWKSKAKYKGAWKNDQKHGEGFLEYANGNKYKGDFKNGMRCGRGTLKYANGDVYKGQFTDNKKHGNGKITYANEDVYKGMFLNDEKHGQGTYTYHDDKTVKQNYINGQLADETVSAEQAATTTSSPSDQLDDTIPSIGDDTISSISDDAISSSSDD